MALEDGGPKIEKALQFLVCPQRDFIDRLDEGQERPNALHVGFDGARKIRGAGDGPDPFVDTTMRLFADTPETARVEVIIDEDWHPRSCAEFPIFGEHCVKGSEGAQLVGELEELRWHPRTHVLRANNINVAAHPQYRRLLDEVLGGLRPDQVRVGVYGVWTNVKVEYLLISLLTCAPRFPMSNIALLEPLCACPDPRDHDQAIDKLERVLGFQVFRRVEPYLAWLGVSSPSMDATLSFVPTAAPGA